jgi:hypothetical protein
MVVVKKPATKEHKGINPFTGQETVFKAKPARKVIKARPAKEAIFLFNHKRAWPVELPVLTDSTYHLARIASVATTGRRSSHSVRRSLPARPALAPPGCAGRAAR